MSDLCLLPLIFSLEAITLREQSLNLFHALGKVFYNKRAY